MLKRLGGLLTARTTVVVLLVLLAAAMTVAAVVPQRAGPPGPDAAPAGLVDALGLTHVFSTPWFGVLAGLFVAALALSTVEQLRLARARTFLAPPARIDGTPSPLGRPDVEAILREEGYRALAADASATRLVRGWSGYWGSFCLHAGMTTTALFAIAYVLTEHRVVLHVTSGRGVAPGDVSAERGLLARDLPLPVEVNLYRVEPAFSAGALVDVASRLVFTAADGAAREVRVAVNDYQDYRGLTVYQLQRFGNVFALEVEAEAGPSEIALELPYPEKPGVASYGERPLPGGQVLKAKYFPGADRSRLEPGEPELVLRLQDGDRVVGEATLREGDAARLGPLSVRLARVGWWTELLFEGSLGTTGIFAGFAVLLLGAVLAYFAVPREVVVRDAPGGCTVQWRAARFADMYTEERDRILGRCTGGRT